MKWLGLKLWSVNLHYAAEAEKLYNEGVFDYIELSAIPGSLEDTAATWKKLKIPYIIHAPHFMQGLNLSDPLKEKSNAAMAEEAFRYADRLEAEYVIFHPGIKGDFRETARQIKNLNDGRVLVENKPYRAARLVNGLTEKDACVGWSPEQMKFILKTAGAGFCLDIGHCFCAANGTGRDKYAMLDEFLSFFPKMFHISDGDAESSTDKHYCIGKGSYDFKKIFSALPERMTITLETEKTSEKDLDSFRKDAEAIRKFI